MIRIGIQPKMLGPDPDEMNADPQPCLQRDRAVPLKHRFQRAAQLSERAAGATQPRRAAFGCVPVVEDVLAAIHRLAETGVDEMAVGLAGAVLHGVADHLLHHAGFRIRIRINLSCWIRIRIRIQSADPDPDPGGQK